MPLASIRAYHSSDLPSLYRICHATGLAGRDAGTLVADPDLFGHVYAGPYPLHDARFCSVIARDSAVLGYLIATIDCEAFYHFCEREWFPPLRRRYPLPNDDDLSITGHLLRTVHRGHVPPANIDLVEYPATLHIDLLPEVQGLGLGRTLMQRLFSQLRDHAVPGVHLYVAAENTGAIAFYERIGFQSIDTSPGAFGYGYKL